MTGALPFFKAAAARFKPAIFLRVPSWEAWEEFRRAGPTGVTRYGVLPDGSEVSLGPTVSVNLAEARARYWRVLFDAGLFAWAPRLARWTIKRWYPVEVQGYEMTPLPPKER